jgi:hypothetical protein
MMLPIRVARFVLLKQTNTGKFTKGSLNIPNKHKNIPKKHKNIPKKHKNIPKKHKNVPNVPKIYQMDIKSTQDLHNYIKIYKMSYLVIKWHALFQNFIRGHKILLQNVIPCCKISYLVTKFHTRRIFRLTSYSGTTLNTGL